ncbi:MAG: hypothetical protein Q8933_09270 [Bacteroidota bacterium]|nr:hypothetical protein [Bacteroidota bacterium]
MSFLINTSDNSTENPYQSAEGQQPVSIAEPFWVRMNREGMMAFGYRQSIGTNNTYSTVSGIMIPSKGRRLYLARFSVSSDKALRATIQITGLDYARRDMPTSDSMVNTYLDTFFVPQNGCVERVYNGELWLEEGMSLDIKYQTLVTSETGLLDVSAMGWEVAVNA